MKVYGVIYLLINAINDKEYVGQTTKTAEERFKEHMYSPHCIGNAIRKHGAENFVIAILKVCYSKAELDFWGRHFIKSRNTTAPNGYNIAAGGEGCAVFTPSPETCLKISVPQRKESPFKNLAKEIRQSRFTYSMLAKRLDSTPSIISPKIGGKRNFSATEWIKLAEIFGKPADYLMVRDDDKPSVSKLHNSPYKNLIWEIDKRKITYTRLSQILALPRENFSEKMHGKYNFSEAEWAKLVEIFGMPADYLMFRSDGLPAITSEAERRIKLSVTHRQYTPFKNLLYEISAHKLSYRSLSTIMGLCNSSISHKMLGKQNFTEKDIAKLVEIFGKPADYLMKRDDTE